MPAREAFEERFLRQVDPERLLSEAERSKRAEFARKAYFHALAARSAQARSRRRREAGLDAALAGELRAAAEFLQNRGRLDV